MLNIIDCQRILQEIREELADKIHTNGTPYSILSAINIMSCDYNIGLDKGLRITINLIGIHKLYVDIPEKYIEDKEFVKHQIVGEIATYLDIVSISIGLIKEHIFDYQNQLVRAWEQLTHQHEDKGE